MEIDITRRDLEAAVPAARHKDSTIFNALLPAIEAAAAHLTADIVGTATLSRQADGSPLTQQLRRAACLRAFARQVPYVDVVLTATGFGIVSTNDTAPASRERVEAIRLQADHDALLAEGDLLKLCFNEEGWADDMLEWLPNLNLFFHPRFLERFAGQGKVTREAWRKAQPLIDDDIDFLTDRVSSDLMEDLVRTMCTPGTPPAAYRALTIHIRRHVGAALRGADPICCREWKALCNCLDDNLDALPLYAASKAYRLNHPQPWRNTPDSPAFHFVG